MKPFMMQWNGWIKTSMTWWNHPWIYGITHARVRARTHARTHACTHARTHTHTHTHTHITWWNHQWPDVIINDLMKQLFNWWNHKSMTLIEPSMTWCNHQWPYGTTLNWLNHRLMTWRNHQWPHGTTTMDINKDNYFVIIEKQTY